eukprot:CAMPEP_0202496820 /NCGR_PEP_ID=MMETSP1361-20130828/21047_1 /ASSEMBLY_ACC=CAM_ASM_000849 /TAXON_ID=210615 /ORGANISM="Staurosira complex sp., Strain CCMP2646" /LENGTH=379 /DNA_ID=CAMNT_0049128249 /DNA_START=766 /DNA_END=1901 /DNA_ORIENTATION=-
MLVVLATLLRGGHVHAFPSEAGSCRAGGFAVGGSHRSRTQVGGGPLSDHGLELSLEGTKLQAGNVSQIVVGTSYSLELLATTSTNTFRGFLMRLESPNVDTIEAMSVPENANGIQVSEYFCVGIEGVGGLTHTTSNDKTQASGLLQVDETAVNLTLDVTVVVQNRQGVSEWYYSQFLLQAISFSPTPAPVVPTKPPTMTPKPSPAPTMNPSPSTTNKPTRRPSPLPMVSPTPLPVTLTQPPSNRWTTRPTKTPTPPMPTNDPTASPTQQPSQMALTQPPSNSWTTRPTKTPTLPMPTNEPATSPTNQPSQIPSVSPSGAPTLTHSLEPSSSLSLSSSEVSSNEPSSMVTVASESPSSLVTLGVESHTMSPTTKRIDTSA